ncbi:putative quinol monooxygenase [Streptomyces canus]|uniref:putative quinol monooxygenase n=1 Tax=Streptomyces canus TaxID=58343 RepID=UPI0033B844DC
MTITSNHYVTVLWEARAKAGKEAAMRAFMTAAVTASRHDAGNIDYEAHQVEGQPGAFVILERPSKATCRHPACRTWCPNCWN